MLLLLGLIVGYWAGVISTEAEMFVVTTVMTFITIGYVGYVLVRGLMAVL